MKHFSVAVLTAAFVLFSLSSCSKKSDAPGADSTKAAADASKSGATGQSANTSLGKYPIKSGIIHGESETMGMKGTTTKYFDDYGAKVCEETSSTITMGATSIKTNKVRIIKDGWMYSYEPEKKTGVKMKFAIPANMDFRNMGEKMMKDMGIKEAGTETILGKECKIYEYSGGQQGAMTGRSWIFWNAEPMKMDMKVANMTMKSHVTSIEENVAIPADKFEVPSNITLKEMSTTMPPVTGGK
ncbi:MAG: hypothetical protein ACHQM6_02720 [Candidatus Kapaibacterium sp.]